MAVSVVIPAQNRADTLPHQLRALTSHARNVGADHAQGQVIAFCDCDDYVAESWVQAAWDGTQAGADILGGDIRISTHVSNNPANHTWELSSDSGARNTSFGRGVTSCNMVFRASAFKELGGFDESLPAYGGEDSELCIRASLAGFKFATQPGLVIYFTPTLNNKTLVKKVFNSGIAQAIVFHHHRSYYGEPWKPQKVLQEIFRWTKHLASQKNPPKKYIVRGYLVRFGTLWGSIRHTYTGWPEPRYFNFQK